MSPVKKLPHCSVGPYPICTNPQIYICPSSRDKQTCGDIDIYALKYMKWNIHTVCANRRELIGAGSMWCFLDYIMLEITGQNLQKHMKWNTTKGIYKRRWKAYTQLSYRQFITPIYSVHPFIVGPVSCIFPTGHPSRHRIRFQCQLEKICT